MNKFFAEIVARSQGARSGPGVEITLGDAEGRRQTVCLSADAIAALAEILSDFSLSTAASREHLTKVPESYAVGHGRYEPFVLLRFEDEPPYGLSPEHAASLGMALLEEAAAIASVRYAMTQ